jgi:hypothetical protein
MPRGDSELPDDPSKSGNELRAEVLHARRHVFSLTGREAADRLRSFADELHYLAIKR